MGLFSKSPQEKVTRKVKAVANLLRHRSTYTSRDLKKQANELLTYAQELERLGL